MTEQVPVINLPGNSMPLEIDHVMTEIGPDLCEYRGHFIAKSRSGWTVLEPAPSKNVFGVFPNLWDVEEAVDAFLDRGVEPFPDEEPTTAGPAEYRFPNNQKAV